MKLNMLLVLAVMTILGSSFAHAGVALSPTISHISTTTRDSNDTPETKDDETTTYIDLRLGYIMPGGLYFGGIYGLENGTFNTTTADGERSASRIGASLGFIMGGFNLIGHYFLSAQEVEKRSSTTKDTYTDGSGLQIDIGWAFPLTGTIMFGPQLTWSNMTYKKREHTVNNTTTDSAKNYVRTEIRPHFAFWFMF